jgi:hypothetical protein
MRRITLVLVVGSLLVPAVLSGCNRQAEASGSGGSSATAVPATGTTAAPPATTPVADPAGAGAAAAPASRVARIVFLDKEQCCDCTRKAQEASWTAIQTALGGAAIPVERIHFDTQSGQAEPYRALRPMMASPGIYFLDAAGGLVEQLQGEVTADQVRAVLFP